MSLTHLADEETEAQKNFPVIPDGRKMDKLPASESCFLQSLL